MERISDSKKYKAILGVLLLGMLINTFLFSVKPNLSVDLKQKYYAPIPMQEKFTFGYRMPMADLLWLRTLQDTSYCDNPINKNVCHGNSWLFHMYDLITNLSPDFEQVYLIGGLVLSIVISDIEGASKIFDKGTKQFPNNGFIAYQAAYHALIEEEQPVKAANLLLVVARVGGPPWTYSLATRLLTDNGKKELAERVLSEAIDRGVDQQFIDRMKKKLQGTPAN